MNKSLISQSFIGINKDFYIIDVIGTKMRITMNGFIAMFLMLVSIQAHALPKAFTASYTVEKSGISLGSMQSKLSYTDNQYTYQKITKATGLAAMLSGDTLTENSRGLIQNDTFVSKAYQHHHKSKRKDKKDQLSFETAGSARGSYETKPYELAVPNGTTDLAALELQLMHNMLSGKHQSQYHVVSKGSLKVYAIERAGTELLDLSTGNYHCEKLVLSRKDSDIQTTLWLAKELDYFPVRIQNSNKGKLLTATITSHATQ
jgi:hypothetical protein